MNSPSSPKSGSGKGRRSFFFSQFNNWISATGAVGALSALFAFFLLFALDATQAESSPYLGILTFIVAPFFLILGLCLMFVGWLVDRYYLSKLEGKTSFLQFSLDFSQRRERKKFVIFIAGGTGFLFLSALGSYKTYHFTESNMFCGEVCHTIMEPEYATYALSPHARVNCVECHIGEGATWYVKAKIDGLYQVYAALANKYPTPVPTPIESLRPAQDTCEKCHWPQVFTGNLDRTYEHFMADYDDEEFTTRIILKVGGGDPRLGDVRGIHWHTDPNNKVEYIAVDEKRLEVPWVRLKKGDSEEVVFMHEDYDMEDLEGHEIRTMDCMDCHNRPAHILLPPNDAVDRAISLKRLNPEYTDLKYTVVDLLVGEYGNTEEAYAAIREGLLAEYEEEPDVETTIEEVQRIYTENFFPKMKADWSAYPNHIGHKNWPGCFRCHGGSHYNVETEAPMQAGDCNDCHTILAQGSGADLLKLAPGGLEFAHPDGDVSGLLCSDCHTGGPQ
ncbi:MAG: cytochrome c3 family protein [Puniceicoccaceae bacterium]